MTKWETEREILENLINTENLSYEEIGRKYGCTGANIKKVAKKLGLKIPQRRNINPCETFRSGTAKMYRCLQCGKEFRKYGGANGLFCSTSCFGMYKHIESYQKVLNGDESIMRANYSPSKFRDFILKEQGNKCAVCGNPPIHNDKPLVFIVDHIDGNAANNKRTNLRCVCPNCDSQLDTYKYKNKNGARHYYRYHKYKE